MVKSRGCSCWPFGKQPRKNKQKETQSSDSSYENSHSQNSRRQNNNIFINQQNINVIQIQRQPYGAVNQQMAQQQFRARTHDIRSQYLAEFVRNAVVQQEQLEQEQQNETEEIRRRNKVRIKTKVSKKDVQYIDDFPTETDKQLIFKYCCPICLRYFNNMLISTCCKNYICRFCIGDMARKAKLDRNFIIKCSHCFEVDFKLEDVKQEDTVKFYTDTPFKHAKTRVLVSSSKKVKREFDDCGDINQEISPNTNQKMMNLGNESPSNNNQMSDDPMFGMQSTQMQIQKVLIGDNEHPDYESPYPFQSNSGVRRNSKYQQNNSNIHISTSPFIQQIQEEHKLQEDLDDRIFNSLNKIENGNETLDSKMRELTHSRKSLIGERNSYQVRQEEESKHSHPQSPLQTNRQIRVSSASSKSIHQQSIRKSITQFKQYNNFDIDQIINSNPNIAQPLRLSDVHNKNIFNQTTKITIKSSKIKIKKANFIRHEPLNEADKENVSPNNQLDISQCNYQVMMTPSHQQRQPLHQMYQRYHNASSSNKDQQSMCDQSARQNRKRSVALVQASQEILSPLRSNENMQSINISMQPRSGGLRAYQENDYTDRQLRQFYK